MTTGAVIEGPHSARTSARGLLAALAVCAGFAQPAAGGGGTTETGDAPLDYPVFDANHCLTGVTRQAGSVELHWGCSGKHLITMACVFDGAGYPGPGLGRAGWHCNHPLPVLEDEDGRRISDVAVGGAPPGLGFVAQLAPVLADDASCDSEAEPRAAVLAFGGIEGVCDPRKISLRNSRPLVLDSEEAGIQKLQKLIHSPA